MSVQDYWGGESVDLDVDTPTEVDLNGNPVTPGSQRYIPKDVIEDVGDLIVGAGDSAPVRLPVGDPGEALIVLPDGSLGYGVAVDPDHTHTESDITDFAHTHPIGDLPGELATDVEVTGAVSAHAAAADPHTGYQKESEKGAASGYASLDGTTKVPTAELGTGTASSSTYLRGDRTWAAVTQHSHDGAAGNTTVVGDSAEATVDQGVAIGDFARATSDGAVAIGSGTNTTTAPLASGGRGAIAIGPSDDPSFNGARANGTSSIAIGSGTNTTHGAAAATSGISMGAGSSGGTRSLSIGINSAAPNNGAIAIGAGSSTTTAPSANANGAIAIGASDGPSGAKALGIQSIAIGSGDASTAGASAAHANSVAIGKGSATTVDNQIRLGSATHSVSVPGSLNIVGALTVGGVGVVGAALLDVKGDLIVASAADTPARLPAGSNGQVLTANSATATGLEWANPTTVVQQASEPASPSAGTLWLDTDEGSGVGLSSIIAYAQVAADQGPFSALTDLTGLSVTVTVPAGRRLRITGSVLTYATVVDDVIRLSINGNGTELQRRNVTARPASWGLGHEVSVVVSPTAGSHTYKLQMARDAGTGDVFMQASANWPAWIMVEDITGSLWPAGQSIGAGTIASEAFTSWTPVVSQGNTPTPTLYWAGYSKIGRLVTAHFAVGFTSEGTASNAIQMTIPVPAVSSFAISGSWSYFDAGNTIRAGTITGSSATTVRFKYDGWGNDFGNGDMVIANGDDIRGVIIYEAAS